MELFAGFNSEDLMDSESLKYRKVGEQFAAIVLSQVPFCTITSMFPEYTSVEDYD